MACEVKSAKTPLEEVLECKLCKKQLSKPHTLSKCLHSYCQHCLETISKKENDGQRGLFCAQCGNFNKENDVRHNEFIEDLLTISKTTSCKESEQKKVCQQCLKEDHEVTGKCVDCKLVLCIDCQFTHLQIPILKDHKIANLNEENETFIDKLIYCKIHKSKPLEYNCENCDTLICITCNLSAHKAHSIQTIEESLNEMLPQVRGNIDKTTVHIQKMEGQLNTVTKKIDDTKEIYSARRLELDDRLDIIINRLKAAKAELEDEVTEQETIALNILQSIKLKLEQDLSVARNVVNLVSVAKENAKHTSLLREMQSGLKQKARECCESGSVSFEFKIKIPELENGCGMEQTKVMLQNLIGELSYNEPLCNLNTLGEIWPVNDYICDDLTQMLGMEFEKAHEINLDASQSWCNRLSYINGYLWIGLGYSGEIKMYHTSGEVFRTVPNDKGIIILKKANNGDIIAGGHKGLFVTDEECSTWTKLTDGGFSDVCTHKNQFCALKYKTSEVYIYELKRPQHRTGDSDTYQWEKVSSFVCNTAMPELKNSSNNTLLIDANSHFICCYHSSNVIVEMTEDGTFFNSYDATEKSPCLCGIDKFGHILVASFSNGNICVANNLQDLTSSNPKSELYIKGHKVADVVIDNDKNVWLLVRNNFYKLVKYVPV